MALPAKVTFEQAKGFSFFAMRTILSGGGDEIIELATTNLRMLATELQLKPRIQLGSCQRLKASAA
jgi:hypothetical protein